VCGGASGSGTRAATLFWSRYPRRPDDDSGDLVDYSWVTDGVFQGDYEAVRRAFRRSGYPLPQRLNESPSFLTKLTLVEQSGLLAPGPALFSGGDKVFASYLTTLRGQRPRKRVLFVRFPVDRRSVFILRLAEFLVEIPVLTDGACDASNDDDRYEC
jgi:hypothetical protein